MARVIFAGAQIRVRGYVNFIGEPRAAGQSQVMDVRIGWTTAPRKGESEGRRQTVKASIWASAGSPKNDIESFRKWVRRGDLITITGEVELDEYTKPGGQTETMMRIANVESFEPMGRETKNQSTPVDGAAAKLDPLADIDSDVERGLIPF